MRCFGRSTLAILCLPVLLPLLNCGGGSFSNPPPPPVSTVPSITGFSPTSASVGAVVTVTGTNLTSSSGGPPQLALAQQGGGTIAAPLATFTATSVGLVIPAGATTGPITVSVAGQSATSTSALSIVPSQSYTIAAVPSTATVIRGQSAAYAVTLSSGNGYSQLATLAVSGLPSGTTATFSPTQITAGQTSILTVTAPASQAAGSATLTITASSAVQGIAIAQTATATLNIQAASTSFLGRTVVDNSQETPIAGVTVKFLGKDDKGNITGCSSQTSSDAGGNFLLANLPGACIGPQLISYDGSTATSPAGKYAGVNLSYTLISGAVTTSPVLIHLPRIDNAETVQVQQNSPTDQVFTYNSIPGLQVTVYAGTTLALDDGSKPNPFPLVAISIPIDRLPDAVATSGMLMPFIVAFQPANAVASQPVAINFPNLLNTPPASTAALATLDPTRGYMVPYGTATVSNDGTHFIADPDPAHPGHGYGLVHFDWHGPMVQPQATQNPSKNPCKEVGSPPRCGKPIDLSTGIEVFTTTDITIAGSRGSIYLDRTYRTLSSTPGPFGVGTGHNYSYLLDLTPFTQSQGFINLIWPDGNVIPMVQQSNGSYVTSSVESLLGAVLTGSIGSGFSLRYTDGTTYQFQTLQYSNRIGFLTAISDPNGNTVTLTRNPSDPYQLTQVTDPVGRSLNLAYDSNDRIITVTDPLGRTLNYSYNNSGNLQTFTDAAGGTWSYSYANLVLLSSVTDSRGVVIAQNSYDSHGHVAKQVAGDGGVYNISYTLLNPMVATSPVLLAVETDPQGNQTTYHFDPTGNLLDATDAMGQQRFFGRQPQTGLLLSLTGDGACPVCGDTRSASFIFTYDANGNLLTQTDSLGNTTAFTYEPVFNQVTSVADPLGHTWRYSYDANGNLTGVSDPNGHAVSLAYNAFGLPTKVTDPLGNSATIAYDGAGNVTAVTDPLGNTKSAAYDLVSRLIQITDALGRKTQASYDVLDRLVSTTNPLGNSIRLTYDPVDNPLSLTDERGNTTSFTYDALNRLLTRTDPRGKTDRGAYDFDGNLTTLVDRKGQTSHFSFDSLNRLLGESFQDGSTANGTYDAFGRVSQIVDSVGGSFDYTVDAVGRILNSSTQFGTIQFAYDADSRTTSRQVSGQSSVQYSYDPVGNLLSATLPSASAIFSYDPRNLIQGVTRSNNVTTSYGYDTDGRVLSITNALGSSVINSQSYSYDAVGARSAIPMGALQLPKQAVSSQFDVNNRLVQSTTTAGTTTYSYDDDGNLISVAAPAGTTAFTWDSRNRLTSVTQPTGAKSSFLYDFGFNLLSQTDTGTGTTRNFILDDLTNVAAINQSNGDNLATLSGRRIDQHLGIVHASGQVEYGLTDAVNSTTATVDQSGKALATLLYQPYGLTAANGSDYPFQFTGRVPTVGVLYYYRTRYYDSLLGRFISEDPIGLLSGNSSLYAYVQSDPLDYSDALGLKPGDDYATPGDAAKAALQDIYRTSMDDKLEYAGRVYQKNLGFGPYSYTPPNKGDPGGISSTPGACPLFTANRGFYHTHPKIPHYDHEHFSKADKKLSFKERQPGYLGTADGKILQYIPITPWQSGPVVPLGSLK